MPVWVHGNTSACALIVVWLNLDEPLLNSSFNFDVFFSRYILFAFVLTAALLSLLCTVVPGLRTPDSDRPLPSSHAPPCLPWVWPSNVPTGVTRQDLPAALNAHRPPAWLQQNPEQIQTTQLNTLTTNILSICISHIYSSRCMVSIPIFIYSNCPALLSPGDWAWKWRDLIYLETCMIFFFFFF